MRNRKLLGSINPLYPDFSTRLFQNVFMLFKTQYLFLLFCFVVWSCSELLITSWADGRLHDDEVQALRQILVTMGATPSILPDRPCEDRFDGAKANISCYQCNQDNVCHVKDLRLKDLHLSGMLPPELVDLTYLEVFDVTRNFLHGPLPAIWSTMTHLNFISLTANRLSGEIPREWGNFANLFYLSFEANNFSGNIPEELGNLVNLTHLFFSSNNFLGRVPNSLASLTKLQDLRFSDNNFEGTIPDFIRDFTKLNRLEMFASGFEGPIPDNIFQKLQDMESLLITDMAGPESAFPIFNTTDKTEIHLVLRNVNLSGSIPDAIWKDMARLDMLDVSFNNLEGEPYPGTNTAKHMFFTRNKLNGSVPGSFLSNPMGHNIDLSYNNFTWSASNCNEIENSLEILNTYKSSSLNNKKLLFPCSDKPNCQQYRKSSLHINCGGPSVTVKNANGSLDYEGDTEDGYGSAKSYTSGTNYWGFSSTGDFLDDNEKEKNYIKRINGQSGDSESLYATARRSPLSLTYFGCLENGLYTVKLHFAEIELIDGFERIGRRVFDVYIQGERVTKDFNTVEEANRTSGNDQAFVKQYLNVNVTDNTLEIRFYWAGKGTRIVPKRGNYGILISAISVCPSSKSHCEEHEKGSVIPIVAGVVASVLSLIFLLAGFIIWRRRRRNKYTRERSSELRGLELLTGSFSLRQLRAATNDFDPANKIGEGGFGIVYKGQLPDGTVIAVKQMSSKSRQGNREFVTEIGVISGLQHPNLVKLYGCCIEGNQLLLVYEYMENNCLGRSLFGGPEKNRLKLDWSTRFNICVGIAKGLHFLHEGSPLKIVHRDIKATNVLLDKDLNAKISDFGLAKLHEEDNSHISTRVAGTIGYMAPEYALWGYLTEKADIYSFGVVALETVSGKSNTNYMLQNNCVCLLDYAFVLQRKAKLLELMDPNLGHEFNKEEAERVIKVALLCTNASPVLRPTMSEAIDMLEGRAPVQEVVSDQAIYGDDLDNDVRFKPLRAYYQQIQSNSATETKGSNLKSSDPSTSNVVSSTHDRDLYEINPQSLTIPSCDLYQISLDSNTNTSDISSLMSHHSSSTFR